MGKPANVSATGVRGVTLYRLPVFPDPRGKLSVGEFQRDIPFLPQRYFLVFEVPSLERRGAHAHRECHQFLQIVRGSGRIGVDDGQAREEFALDQPHLALHTPPMTWVTLSHFSPDAMLIVFCSHYYDPADYLHDYDDFCRQARAVAPSAA